MEIDLYKEFAQAVQEGYYYGDFTINSYGVAFIEFSTGRNGRGDTKEIRVEFPPQKSKTEENDK
jgi:hypothetical protein